MKHLIDLFLARGMKFTDLFWIGGGAVVFFLVAVCLGRMFNSFEDEGDPWNI